MASTTPTASTAAPASSPASDATLPGPGSSPTTSYTSRSGPPAQVTSPPAGGPVNVPSPHPDVGVTDNPGAHDQTTNVDNTKVNDRDRHGTLTPMNQGNSADETKITASIRKGLMGDKSLSFTAKNVKIITIGTTVTLRGPVKSDNEKAAIETLAKQTPGVTDVDDQIEVKK